jgi:tetratricopeptide (TPR) repeat protein
MGWRGHPTRFLWTLGGVLAAAVALSATTPSLAQRTGSGPSETVIGSSANAQRCNRAAMQGLSTDADLAACNQAIEIDRLTRRELIPARMNRGVMLLRRGNVRAAIADFDATLALDPENAEAHSNRGTALLVSGQPGQAVAALTHALSIGVSEPHKAYYNRGAAREMLGDLPGAYEDYSTALRIKPDWGAAEAELARSARAREERLARIIGVGGGSTAPSKQEGRQ